MPITTPAADPLSDQLLAALRESGALLEGHFVLSSGLHSAQYVQCARLLAWPGHAEFVGQAIARRLRDAGVDVVIGPALGGVLVAHEVARALGVRSLFAERVPTTGQLALRRGFEIRPGERAWVCEDVVTTGGSARETADLIEEHGGIVAGFAAIVDRSAGDPDPVARSGGRAVPFHALLRRPIEAHESAACPLCAAGSTAIKPGSRR